MGLPVKEYICYFYDFTIAVQTKTFDTAVLKVFNICDKEKPFEVDKPVKITVKDTTTGEIKIFTVEKKLRVEWVYREDD